jgi:hypothetical protein
MIMTMDLTENQQADFEFAPSPDPQPSSEYRDYADFMKDRLAKQWGIPAYMLTNCNSNYSGHYRGRSKRKEQTFQKRFVVQWRVWKSVRQRLLDGVNQCNSRKFGRLQRGEVSLTQVTGIALANRLCELILTFVIGRPRYKYLNYRAGAQHAFRREGVRGDYDYRPVLSILGKAAAKVSRGISKT